MIKNHLSRLLGERRWSQARLARETGIRPSTICAYYNEFADRFSLDHLDRICEALGCSVADLLEYVPSNLQKTGDHLLVEEHGNRHTQ
ncbi:MAG: XRE family transcriptional regulator [Subdoligranulum variabile]|nr:MAG: XRE family transcriptional regulator [Subdoligranulum variabile]